MTLRNGKFYDEAGNVVPLEIGNTEQIKLIQKYQREEQDLKDGCMITFDPRTDESGQWTLYAEVECLCGVNNPVYETAANEILAYENIDGAKVKCGCGRHYTIDLDELGFFYRLKMTKWPKK